MKIQPFQQPNLTTRPTIMRRFQAPVLGLIALVAVLAIMMYATRENAVQTPLARPVLTQLAIDAASQGVNSYLQAHANIAKAVAVDPTVVSVTNYLNAHRIAYIQQSDAATRGANGYLLAHANLAETSVVDPAVASVSGDLRAHDIVLISR